MKSLVWFGVLATLSFLLAGASECKAQLPSTDDLLAKVQDAFRRPAPELAPAVVVFPAVDGDSRVRRDGFVFSQTVGFSMTYRPHRRMAVSMPHALEIFGGADCSQSGEVLTENVIRDCLLLLGSPSYAIPRFVPSEKGYLVTVEFRSQDERFPDKEFSLEIESSEYGKATGMIARAVLEHVGVELSSEELALLERPQLQSEDDSIRLSEILWHDENGTDAFLKRNPTSVLAWESYATAAQDGLKVIELIESQREFIQCDRLAIAAAVIQRKIGRPRTAMDLLLDLAPSHMGDTYYFASLVKTALLIADDRIVEQVFSSWRESGNDYGNLYYRATLLKDWGWQARGEDLAVNVPPEAWATFHERLNAALEDLRQAVKLNPRACAPYAEMINIATGIGLPYEFVNECFDAAVKIKPDFARVYHAKLGYLRPLWFGTPERLIPFAKQCLESGLWEEGVPQLLITAIRHAYMHQYEGTYPAAPFQSEELWGLIETYYSQVMKHGSPEDQRLAMNYYVLWGSLGQRYAELEGLFEKLAYNGATPLYESTVFYDRATFLMMWDRTLAHTGKKFDSREAKVRVALNDGQFADAEQILDDAKPNNFHETSIIQHYRRVLDLGRELQQTKRVDFSGMQIKHAFDSIHDHTNHRFSGELRDGKYVCKLEPRYQNHVRMIFPVAFQRATLSGSIKFTPGISYIAVSFRLRSGQSPVTIAYYPQTSQLALVEQEWTRNQAELSSSDFRFRIEIGEVRDSMEVNDDIVWEMDKTPIEPGTFAIHAIGSSSQTTELEIDSLVLTLED